MVDRVDDQSRHKKYVAIEVTFQETSNSTIERKGGQARDRFEKITSCRDYIAYVIDGAGNFSRRSAVSTLCENSHCNVAYTPDEFEVLIEFIKEKILLSGTSKVSYLLGMSIVYLIFMMLGSVIYYLVGLVLNFDFGMIDSVFAIFQPTEEQLALFIEMFVGKLPDYIRNSLTKAAMAS